MTRIYVYTLYNNTQQKKDRTIGAASSRLTFRMFTKFHTLQTNFPLLDLI